MRAVLTGLLFALVSAVILSVLMGGVLYLTPLPEFYLPLLSNIIMALAVFGGGLQAARLAMSRGLFHGIGVALIFYLIIITIGWTGEPFVTLAAGKKLLTCLLAGSLGGIAGVTVS